MKILTAQQIREADAATMANEPITSLDLMERAATACVRWVEGWWQQVNPAGSIAIFCGMGNNGGDGLVMARQLLEKGLPVTVYVVRFAEQGSADFVANAQRLTDAGGVMHAIENEDAIPDLQGVALVVDAIFGSGLSRPVEGFVKTLIAQLNAQQGFHLAIDVPSGLFGEDNSANDREAIFQADVTLTFQQPRLAFLFPENARYLGQWEVLPIGLDPDFLAAVETPYHLVSRDLARLALRDRSKFSHKGTFGHALLAAGSFGTIGAAVLAARACLRSGVGLLTVHVPSCGYAIMQTAVPEAMVVVDEGAQHLHRVTIGSRHSAVAVGPGIGQAPETAGMLKQLIQESAEPMVLDADALNLLAANKTWIPFLPARSILTPHPKEFERLVGSWESDFERHTLLREFARKHGLYVVLKGAHTAIAAPDGDVFFNTTGNPGMATAGSGDVLTGILVGLLAQGYGPKAACLLGVYLHGVAGDLAAEAMGQEAMVAGDLITQMGLAFKFVREG